MSGKHDGSNRRRFFRIDDRLLLGLARAELADAGEQAGGMPDVLADIDRRIAAIVAAARTQAPAVAELAELLNRKLNHVIDTLRLNAELAQRASYREYDVSLSACGIGLSVQEPYEAEARLVLDVIFPPEDHMRIGVRVVRCLEQNNGAWLLHLDFVDIGEADQEYLIQYILRRQSNYLNTLREKRGAFAGWRPES